MATDVTNSFPAGASTAESEHMIYLGNKQPDTVTEEVKDSAADVDSQLLAKDGPVKPLNKHISADVSHSHTRQTAPKPKLVPRILHAMRLMLRRRQDDWSLEMLSFFFSALCTGAIGILLVIYSDSALPEWRYGLTINSVISILATFAKGAMVLPVAEALGQSKWLWFRHSRTLDDFTSFDEAVRGPYGSVFLLGQLGMSNLHASLGALTIIFAVAFGPSVQQIPTFPTRYNVTESVPIARARAYSQTFVETGRGVAPDVAPEMKASIYSAAFGSLGSETLTVCPTRSCSWDDYTSLGMCSSCADVSQHLQTEAIGNDTQRLYLPNGASLTSKVGNKDVWINVTSSLLRSYDGLEVSTLVPHYSLAFNDTGYVPIMNLFSIGRGNQSEATECILYWCTRRYRSEFSNGRHQETTLSTWHNKSSAFWSSDGRARWYVLYPPEDQNGFAVSEAAHLTTTWTMQALYQGSGYTTNNFMFYDSEVLTPFHIAQVKGQLADYIDGIAQGVSNRLRIGVSGGRNNSRNSGDLDPVIGTAWEVAETYVNVRWRWFALPVALQALAWYFVCTIMFQTRFSRPKQRIWKSSALANLFHGLSPRTKEYIESPPLLSSMDTTAKMTTVALVGSWLEGDQTGHGNGGIGAAVQSTIASK